MLTVRLRLFSGFEAVSTMYILSGAGLFSEQPRRDEAAAGPARKPARCHSSSPNRRLILRRQAGVNPQSVEHSESSKGPPTLRQGDRVVPDPLPRPSLVFAILSALVVVVGLFMICLFLAAMIVEFNPIAWIGALWMGGFSLVMATQQYRGTFLRSPLGAQITSALFHGFGGLLLLCAGILTVSAVVRGVPWLAVGLMWIPFMFAAIISLTLGQMNARWSKKLRAALASGAAPPSPRGDSLRELLLAVAVVSVMTAITRYFVQTAPPSSAEHVDAADAPFELPPGANDVFYHRGPRQLVAYEFTTDERGFREWVAAKVQSPRPDSFHVPLGEIDSSFTITRHHAYSSAPNGAVDITLTNGLCYRWANQDHGVSAAFDRTTGRAYYHACSH